LRQIIDQVIAGRQIISFDEGLWLSRKKGRPILVEGRVAPICQDDQVTGAICAFWEISPDKDQTYLHFEFANMASHLLRTPLSFIQASTEFLLSSDLEAEDQRGILSKMRVQSQRLTDVTNELLKLLRLEIEGVSVYIEAIALAPLIERVLNTKSRATSLVF
jgi:signal transduction histidine kinase